MTKNNIDSTNNVRTQIFTFPYFYRTFTKNLDGALDTNAGKVSQDCTSSILAPQTSSLKWPVNSCLAESQNWNYLGIPNVWLAKWTLSRYTTSSGFLMTVAKTL